MRFQNNRRVLGINPTEIQTKTKAIKIQTIKFTDIYSIFFINHETWHCPHKEVAQAMFSKK